MKINIQELKKDIENLKPGLSGNKETTEQSNCFAFTEERIYTYNDEISVSIPNPIEFEGVIPSNELMSLLVKLKGEEAETEFDDEELIIKQGRIKAGLVLQKSIEMPIDEINIPKKWYKLPSDFLTALNTCIFTTSSEMDDSVLNNIHCNKTLLESSDNERATRYVIKSKLRKSFLIPAYSAKELVKLKDIIEYYPDNEWIHFRASGDIIFSCRCSYETYPDTSEHFIQDGFEFEFPKETKEMLEKAGIFADSDFIQDKLVQIYITPKGTFKISAQGESGWIEETKRVKTRPKSEIKFSINPQYLQQILDKTNQAIIGDSLVWFNIDKFEHVVSLED